MRGRACRSSASSRGGDAGKEHDLAPKLGLGQSGEEERWDAWLCIGYSDTLCIDQT